MDTGLKYTFEIDGFVFRGTIKQESETDITILSENGVTCTWSKKRSKVTVLDRPTANDRIPVMIKHIEAGWAGYADAAEMITLVRTEMDSESLGRLCVPLKSFALGMVRASFQSDSNGQENDGRFRDAEKLVDASLSLPTAIRPAGFPFAELELAESSIKVRNARGQNALSSVLDELDLITINLEKRGAEFAEVRSICSRELTATIRRLVDTSPGLRAPFQGTTASEMELVKRAIRAGEPVGTVIGAHFYEHGIVVQSNPTLALQLYEYAAGVGQMDAKRRVADAYANGHLGCSISLKRAAEEYKAIARAGNSAMFKRSGDMYKAASQGGEPSHLMDAAEMYNAAAKAGDSACLPMAAEMYEAAAIAGDANAMYWMSRAYSDGIGVERNNRLALFWLERAAEQGHFVAMAQWEVPPHVTRSSTGEAIPDPGYRFKNPGTDDLSVRWTAGLYHPKYPRIKSDADEGYWGADPGYSFVPGTLQTVWKEGLANRDYPNIISAAEERTWIADLGYEFISPEDSLEVRWVPGVTYKSRPNVVTSEKEGVWRPARGYRWVSDAPDDYRVVESGPIISEEDAFKILAGSAVIIGTAAALSSMSDNSGGDYSDSGVRWQCGRCGEVMVTDGDPPSPRVTHCSMNNFHTWN